MKKQDIAEQVMSSMKDYVISVELFRHAVARSLDINTTDMECLSILFHKDIATPSELGKHTNLGSGATSAMLDRLERKGFIERKPNPQDRRGAHVIVTKKTRDTITPLFDSLHKAEQKLVTGYSKHGLELMLDFINSEVAIWKKQREKLD